MRIEGGIKSPRRTLKMKMSLSSTQVAAKTKWKCVTPKAVSHTKPARQLRHGKFGSAK